MMMVMFTGVSGYQRISTVKVKQLLVEISRVLGITPDFGPYANWKGENFLVAGLGYSKGTLTLHWKQPQVLLDWVDCFTPIEEEDGKQLLKVVTSHLDIIGGQVLIMSRGWDVQGQVVVEEKQLLTG